MTEQEHKRQSPEPSDENRAITKPWRFQRTERTVRVETAVREWLTTPRSKRSTVAALARSQGVSVQWVNKLRKRIAQEQSEQRLLHKRANDDGVVDKLQALRNEMLDTHYALNVEQKRYRELLAVTAELALEKRDIKSMLRVVELMNEFVGKQPEVKRPWEPPPMPPIVQQVLDSMRRAQQSKVIDAAEPERDTAYGAQLAESTEDEAKK